MINNSVCDQMSKYVVLSKSVSRTKNLYNESQIFKELMMMMTNILLLFDIFEYATAY